MRNKEKLPSGFIKSCLFVFNNDREQPTTKNDLDKAKNDIKFIIKRIPDEDINACFFNAKYYQKYLNNYNLFFDIKGAIKCLHDNFIERSYNIFINPEKQKKNINFGEYLRLILDSQINDLELGNMQIKKVDENVEKEVNEAIESTAPSEINKKQKLFISRLFTYARENINKMKFFKESNIEDFKKIFLNYIINLNNEMQIDLFDKISEIITNLDFIFSSEFSKKQKELKSFKVFKDYIKEAKDKLKNLLVKGKKVIASIKKNNFDDVKKTLDENKNITKIVLEKKESEKYKKEVKEKLSKNYLQSPPIIGLKNISETNATIQCLSQIEKLTNYFKYYPNILHAINNNPNSLTKSYKIIIDNLLPSNSNDKITKNTNN